MNNEAENKVSKFYNTVGWETEGEITEDAERWEDLRECAGEYVSKCRLRVLRHIPAEGKYILDMASGPIQYKEYLEYSKNFSKRYCVDLSQKALEDARKKIKDHGVFLRGSFLDIQFEENYFDCAISLHTIYHIDKDKQDEVVRKLIAVTKPGKPVIIVYSNPRTLIRCAASPLLFLKNAGKLFRRRAKGNEPDLYFFAHPIKWWKRFQDVADIQIVPWRSFASNHQKAFIPNNRFGKRMFDFLFNMEEQFPNFFVKHFQYPMIILKKKV
jgi:ubiquinone/menaquinone biosynthesis C-methylase UbiE